MYKITIEKVTTERKVVRDWVKVRDRLESDSPERDNYEYREVERAVTEARTIYTQEVEALDLVAVIQAVNRVPTSTVALVPQSPPWGFDRPSMDAESKS